MAFTHSTEYPEGLFQSALGSIFTLESGLETKLAWVQINNESGAGVVVTVTVRGTAADQDDAGTDFVFRVSVADGGVITIPSLSSQNGVIFSAAGAAVYVHGAYFKH